MRANVVASPALVANAAKLAGLRATSTSTPRLLCLASYWRFQHISSPHKAKKTTKKTRVFGRQRGSSLKLFDALICQADLLSDPGDYRWTGRPLKDAERQRPESRDKCCGWRPRDAAVCLPLRRLLLRRYQRLASKWCSAGAVSSGPPEESVIVSVIMRFGGGGTAGVRGAV